MSQEKKNNEDVEREIKDGVQHEENEKDDVEMNKGTDTKNVEKNNTDNEEENGEEKEKEAQEINEEDENNDETNYEELNKEELIGHICSLEEKMNSIEEEKEKYFQKLQRLQADFVNYRNRSKREKKSISLEARIELINEILPVIDNFERALTSEGEEGDFKTGIEMIYKQLMNNLKSQGLKKISTEGEDFDHRYHEAIMQVEDCEEESGIIVEELQKGYMLEDKVIRPAMVKVAK